MAIPFLNNINLSDNQLLNAKLQVTGSAPTAAAGQIYFNSTDNVAKYHNGTAWVDIPRQISVGGTSLADSQAINLVAGANVGIAESSGTITISSSDQFQGTVTSVSSSTAGDALDVTVTNGTTTPDLAFTWAGNPASYVRGDGTLATFPTIPTVPSNIVETVVTTNGTFIDLTPTTATSGDVTITADLSASGTPGDTVYLRGDNAWAPISGIPGTYKFTLSDNASPTPVTGLVVEDDTVQIAANADLTSNLTGETTASKLLTVGLKVDSGLGNANNYVLNQGTEVATADDTIPFNDYTPGATPPSTQTNIVKKTTFGTIPVTALTEVKTYIDNAVAGGLIYQGGFDGSTGFVDGTTDYLDNRGTQIAVNKGWTYTVTVAGTFYGEAVEVGDVLIAEDNLSSGNGSLSDWTTVQNNVDLASLTQVGIGNVNAEPAGNLGGIAVSYNAGTAKVGLDINALADDPLEEQPNNYFIPIYNSADDENKKVASSDLLNAINSATSFAGDIGNGSATSIRLENSGATAPNINHGLGTDSTAFMVQLVDNATGETVYADVSRGAGGQVTIDFATPPALAGIKVLIQKIG